MEVKPISEQYGFNIHGSKTKSKKEIFLNNVSHPHQKAFNFVNIALALKFLK
jgi:hypothetical protein